MELAKTREPKAPPIPAVLRAHLARLFPGTRVVAVDVLCADAGAPASGATEKALGYGRVTRITLARPDGARRRVVLHLPTPDEHGHQRRADRVAEVVSALDDYPTIPRHVRALDAGLIGEHAMVSLAGAGEPYLITEWADGEIYADDLRRIARDGAATARDLSRVTALAESLAALHARPRRDAAAYRASLRALVGSGEGIAGVVDAYPDRTPGAPRARLERIERACLAWRHALRDRADRARRIHGDFHPFNVLFDEHDQPVLLDASRGCVGDPADDVAALTIKFLFFGIDAPERWQRGLGRLWDRFHHLYRDPDLPAVIAPFYAWRGLVLASPRWYPELPAAGRERILRFVEQVLAADRLDVALAGEVMS